MKWGLSVEIEIKKHKEGKFEKENKRHSFYSNLN